MTKTMFVLTSLDDFDADEDYIVAVSESKDALITYIESMKFLGKDEESYLIEEVEVI